MNEVNVVTHVGHMILVGTPWINTTLRAEGGGFINIRLAPEIGTRRWLVAYEVINTQTTPFFIKIINLKGIYYDTYYKAQKAYSLRKRLLKRKLELGAIK